MDRLRTQLAARQRTWQSAVVGLVLAAAVACARYEANASTDSARADSVRRAVQDSSNRAQPGYMVDSIFPIEEEMRRFNDGLERPRALTGGGRSRADLVRLFTGALARRDTSALRGMLVSRAEFGFLIFPESPYTRPPYKTKPGIIWMQAISDSERGLDRLLQRVSGPTVKLSGLECDAEPHREGPNRYWRQCSMLVTEPSGQSRRLRLFGQILERGGHAKFVSYDTSF